MQKSRYESEYETKKRDLLSMRDHTINSHGFKEKVVHW